MARRKKARAIKVGPGGDLLSIHQPYQPPKPERGPSGRKTQEATASLRRRGEMTRPATTPARRRGRRRTSAPRQRIRRERPAGRRRRR